MFYRGYNKFRNKSCKDLQGNVKDSRLEAKHSNQLFLLEKAKKIIGLKAQVKIPFLPKMKHYYICDFVYYDLDKMSLVLLDSKGFINPVYSLKRDLILAIYRGFIFIERYSHDERVYMPYNNEMAKDLSVHLSLNEGISYTPKEIKSFNKILGSLK